MMRWRQLKSRRAAYLLAMSAKHQVRFDKRLTLDAVIGATEDHLHILR